MYFNAAVGLFKSPEVTSTLYSNNTDSAQSSCGGPRSGTFCGQVGTSRLNALFSVGGMVSRRVGLEIEVPVSASRTGESTYYDYAHSEDGRTHSQLEHSEHAISALLRLRGSASRDSLSIDPVIGVTFAHATDRMTNRVWTYKVDGSSVTTTLPRSDVTNTQSALGMTLGVDLVGGSTRHATFVLMVRGRWLYWPAYVITPQQEPNAIPELVNHATLMVGAGIRFGGLR